MTWESGILKAWDMHSWGKKEIKAGKGGDEGRVKSIKKNFTKRYPEQQRHKV